MKRKLLPVLVAGLLSAAAAVPAAAASVTLDFEGPASFASIDNFYADFGVVFGGDALAIRNDELGPYFSNAPSPVGVMGAVGPLAAMNVAVGFYGSASFSYSSSEATSVRLWSGLDGSGDLLGTFNLAANAQSNGCFDSPFCNWSLASLDFTGTARSITFGDAQFFTAFDDVALTTVPLPAAGWLLAMGLAGLGFSARRREK